eukprot:2696906-Pyramimonas_sp.AAC.1
MEAAPRLCAGTRELYERLPSLASCAPCWSSQLLGPHDLLGAQGAGRIPLPMQPPGRRTAH